MCSQRSLTSAISIGNTSEERQSICHTLTERGKIWSSILIIQYRYLTELAWLNSLLPSVFYAPPYQDEQEQIWGGWWDRHERHRKISTSSSLCKSECFLSFFGEVKACFSDYTAGYFVRILIHSLVVKHCPLVTQLLTHGCIEKTLGWCSQNWKKKQNTTTTTRNMAKYFCFIKKYSGYIKSIILHWYSIKNVKWEILQVNVRCMFADT